MSASAETRNKSACTEQIAPRRRGDFFVRDLSPRERGEEAGFREKRGTRRVRGQSGITGESMTERRYPSEYFDAKSSAECGQMFRYRAEEGGYFLVAGGEACFLRTEGDTTVLKAEESAMPFFERYFDLGRDYGAIWAAAQREGGALARAAQAGKGIRIFRQLPFETLVTFLLSQNNNIPRIRASTEKICSALGEKRTFGEREYFAFPTAERMAEADETFYRSVGAGYRAAYLVRAAQAVSAGAELCDETDLTCFYGVGKKVADCVSLFAFHKTGAFPVDTWLEKVYREEFGGREKDRGRIAAFFEEKFGENAGYFQQYLFYAKRTGVFGEEGTPRGSGA